MTDDNPSETTTQPFVDRDTGYRKALGKRQVTMIAIGGSIGTGLFMGAGGRLAQAGPGLALVYLICGIVVFLILRALGELVLHRPSSGSFISYAREFFGEKFAFTTGWLVFINWACTAMADTTAVALYLKFWGRYWEPLALAPQWLLALIVLVVVLALNLISVAVFGELEFWFSLVKVSALVLFLIVGVYMIVTQTPTDAGVPGLGMIEADGGFFPHGIWPLAILFSGVMFAYSAVELIGTAAGETKNPEKVVPKAINTIIVRIALFYVGSVAVLSLLLPSSAYSADESPFVTFFSHLGSPEVAETAASVMNLVVITAALSSLNAGLYSTGRILRSMSLNGSAPRFTGVMSKRKVPYGGILLTSGFTVVGVVLNIFLPADAFVLVTSMASVAIMGGWATIVLCQLRLRRWSLQGKLTRPSFRLFFSPWSGYFVLAFLVFVLVTMAYDDVQRWVLVSYLCLIPVFIGGWILCRKRIRAESMNAGTSEEIPASERE